MSNDCKTKTKKVSAEELERLTIALTPTIWTKEYHEAWHSNLPDTVKVFEALRNTNVESIEEHINADVGVHL